jgi:hypothetical protein
LQILGFVPVAVTGAACAGIEVKTLQTIAIAMDALNDFMA